MRRHVGGAGMAGARARASQARSREASGHRPSPLRGLPTLGLTREGPARRKPRGRAGEESAVRPGSTVPRPKIAAVERRKATRLAFQARGPQGPDRGGAFRRSASLFEGGDGTNPQGSWGLRGKKGRAIRRHFAARKREAASRAP